jgi:hypothetical protein
MAETTNFPEIFPQSEIARHQQLNARRQLQMIIAGQTKDVRPIYDYWFTLESMVSANRYENENIICFMWHDNAWRAMYRGELILFAKYAGKVWYYDYKPKDFSFKSTAYYAGIDEFKPHMKTLLSELYPNVKLEVRG